MVRPSIRKKIILFTVVPITLFYNILSALHIYSSFRASSHEIELQMRNTVVHFAQTIAAHTNNISRLSNAQRQALQNHSVTPEVMLKSLQGSIAFLQRIRLINTQDTQQSFCLSITDNTITQCDESLVKGYNHLTRSALNSDNTETWSPSFFDTKSEKKLVSYHNLFTHDHTVWLLTLDLDINQLIQNVIDPSLFKGKNIGLNMWKFNMADLEGNYIYSDSVQANRYGHKKIHETGQLYGVNYFWNDISELILAAKPESFRVWIPNPQYQKEYWFFGAPVGVGSVNWWLYTSVSRQHALQGILDLALVDGLIMILSLLLILAGILFSSKKITQPLIELKQSMDQFIQHHQLIKKPNIFSRDETGSLARSFVELTQWLANRDEALQEARASNMGHIVQALQGRYFYFQLDKNNDLVHISPSIESVLGYKVDEFSGPFKQFLGIDTNFNEIQNSIQKTLTEQTVTALELDAIHKNGQKRRLEVFWSPVETNSRKSVIEGLANDVTERVSDTLKFKALLDSAPDAMVILNPDGIVVMANSRAVELLGFTREELVNMPLSIVVPPTSRENHPLLRPLHERQWKDTRLFRKETKAIKRAGQPFPAELTSNPLITREGVLISVVVRDISERKRIEQALVSAHDEAISASRSKSLFLSCMSHELRTPLNGVIGYAQLLKRSGGLSNSQQQKLDVLERCGQNLLTLINDILDLTKIETQGVKLHPVSISLREIVSEIHDLFSQRADSKSLLLQVKVDPNVPEWIEADDVKLRQILTNLIGNAIKYTDKGNVELSLRAEKDRINISITDTGIGINEEKIDLIFDPFQQLDEGAKSGGAGLGLAICQHLVEAMGSKLHVESILEQGSCFAFSIPLVLSSSAPEEQSFFSDQIELQLPKEKQYQVLVVDDLKVNRDLLKDIMAQVGFQTAEASNGLEALNWLNHNTADLIMMDIRMPKMGGIEALQEIRKNSVWKPIKVVAVTASVGKDIQTQMKDTGFDGAIAKPFVVNHLLQLVANLLEIDIETTSRHQHSSSSKTLPELTVQEAKQLKTKLTHLIDMGDIQSIQQLAEQFNEPKLKPYADYLTNISETCDMEALERLIKTLESYT